MTEVQQAELVWRWPGAARKAHIYEKGDSVSLCRRWLFTGSDQPLGTLGDKPGPDDCAPCWRKAKARADAN